MTKRQAIALAALVIWILLFLVALVGRDMFPTPVTATAGALSIGAVALVIPVSAIVVLTAHQPCKPNTLGTWAIGMRWGFAIGAAWAIFVGTLLLVPSSRAEPAVYRLFGAGSIGWGLVVAWATYLAFRAKRHERRSV